MDIRLWEVPQLSLGVESLHPTVIAHHQYIHNLPLQQPKKKNDKKKKDFLKNKFQFNWKENQIANLSKIHIVCLNSLVVIQGAVLQRHFG